MELIIEELSELQNKINNISEEVSRNINLKESFNIFILNMILLPFSVYFLLKIDLENITFFTTMINAFYFSLYLFSIGVLVKTFLLNKPLIKIKGFFKYLRVKEKYTVSDIITEHYTLMTKINKFSYEEKCELIENSKNEKLNENIKNSIKLINKEKENFEVYNENIKKARRIKENT